MLSVADDGESTLQRLFCYWRTAYQGFIIKQQMFGAWNVSSPELAEQSYQRLKDIAPEFTKHALFVFQ